MYQPKNVNAGSYSLCCCLLFRVLIVCTDYRDRKLGRLQRFAFTQHAQHTTTRKHKNHINNFSRFPKALRRAVAATAATAVDASNLCTYICMCVVQWVEHSNSNILMVNNRRGECIATSESERASEKRRNNHQHNYNNFQELNDTRERKKAKRREK